MDARLRDVLKGWVERSPFASVLGLVADSIEVDAVALRLPYRPELVTVGEVVHGGAIGALIDSAVAVVSLSGAESPELAKGATVSLTVNFVGAARGCDLVAKATVTRRGRSLVFSHIEVRTAAGQMAAEAMATYRMA